MADYQQPVGTTHEDSGLSTGICKENEKRND
jgi:hypothetical protein